MKKNVKLYDSTVHVVAPLLHAFKLVVLCGLNSVYQNHVHPLQRTLYYLYFHQKYVILATFLFSVFSILSVEDKYIFDTLLHLNV